MLAAGLHGSTLCGGLFGLMHTHVVGKVLVAFVSGNLLHGRIGRAGIEARAVTLGNVLLTNGVRSNSGLGQLGALTKPHAGGVSPVEAT